VSISGIAVGEADRFDVIAAAGQSFGLALDASVAGIGGVGDDPFTPFIDPGQARVFHAAIFLIRRFGGEDRFRTAHEVYAVVARSITEAGRALAVLRPVEHDNLVSVTDDRGVEGPRRLPRISGGRKNWFGRNSPPPRGLNPLTLPASGGGPSEEDTGQNRKEQD